MPTRLEINIQTGEQALLELTAEDLASIAAQNAEQEAMETAKTYAQKRAAAYPPITDYLDGIVKGDQAQIEKYIADCQAVKMKYPKA
jgi:hypothetical protein